MRLPKKERQKQLKDKIEEIPFITDLELATHFNVSIQTIRLDRMELSIPELRERIKSVATNEWHGTVKALPIDDVIGEIIDLELDVRGISILDVTRSHVFSRNDICRGHHLFAQANSLAVAVIDCHIALTECAHVSFMRQVKEGERVIAKAQVKHFTKGQRTEVVVESFVESELVFTGAFMMYRQKE